jgi:hypothetical protein
VGTLFPWVPESGWPRRSRSRLAGRMVVNRYGMGSKWRLLEEHATLLVMAQIL